jgi:uncharacterized protein YrrD
LVKARDIIGLPVICVQDGRKLGEVRDLLIGDWQLKGLLLDPKYWFGHVRAVASEGIASIGSDAVMVSDPEAVYTFGDFTERGRLFMSGKKKLHAMPVVTPNGQQLGFIEDVYFDDQLGKQIIGLELTDGVISDLREGRKIVHIQDDAQLGEDAVIVQAGQSAEHERSGTQTSDSNRIG